MERHRITIPVGATGDNVAVARLHAEAYARLHGFDLAAGSMSVIATTSGGMPMVAHGGTLGVSFDVVVGRGDIPTNVEHDEAARPPFGSWTWSARMEWWAYQLRAITRPSRIRPRDGGASVTAMPGVLGRAFGDPSRAPGEAPWLGRDAIRGDGIRTGIGPDTMPPWMRRRRRHRGRVVARRLRRPTYTTMCRVSAWLFMLATVMFVLGLFTVRDTAHAVGMVAGAVLMLIGARMAAQSARGG